MSRCFPFPPPGYEKKFKAENLDLLTKDKVREKKRKKEKKDKEKKEHKEKREKDRSKDKHKEKKDRKEKRKERKKRKDIDKGRTSEDSRAETRPEGHNEFNAPEILQKEEGKDSKFTEELGRRTRDDGAANQLAGSITSSISKKNEGVGAPSPSLEIERVSEKKVFPVHIDSAQRNYGSGPPVENFKNSLQRKSENISTATSMEKERSKIHEKPAFVVNTEPNRNHGISRPDGISWLVNRKTDSSTAGTEKEKSSEKNTIPNSFVSPPERGQPSARVVASSSTSTRRNNIAGLAVGNHSFCSKPEDVVNPLVHSRMEGVCSAPPIDKERIKGREMFAHQLSSMQRTKATVGQPVEKDRYQKLDGKDTNENRKDEYRKGVKDSDSEKNRPKHTDKHSSDKEKTEKIAKVETVQRNFVKKDQVDTLSNKPLAPHKENPTGIKDVESMKRRNDGNTNGFIHENDARPSKMPRLMSSSQPTDPPFSLPLKDGVMNNVKKPDRTLDNNEKKINGTGKSQLQAIYGRPPAAGGPLENGDAASKSPHPDSKYLRHIYTVPKMEEMSEIDDMSWLFDCCDSRQKPKPRREAEDVPQVWAEALRIESADVLALPYVVPF